MPGDKFAAMAKAAAAAAAVKPKEEESTIPSSGSGDFNNNSNTAEGPTLSSTCTNPTTAIRSSTDSLTSSAASEAPTVVFPTPKRDKLAAMASRAANTNNPASNPALSATDNAESAETITTSTTKKTTTSQSQPAVVASIATGRGNSKLAALAAAQQKKGGDVDNNDAENKILKQTTTRSSSRRHVESEIETVEQQAKKRAEHMAKLQQRLPQRQRVLQDLDRAEEMTCQLLQIAEQTTIALQQIGDTNRGENGSDTSHQSLSQLSAAYRQTIQSIHLLICGGDSTASASEASTTSNNNNNIQSNMSLVKAYQNHSTETNQSMYAARVQMRLAQEKQQLLQTFVDLEQQEQNQDQIKDVVMTTLAGHKRGRENKEGMDCAIGARK